MSNVTTGLIGFAIIGAVFASPAAAASFDCAKAKSSREHLICADHDLAALDEKMGQLYPQRLALLSPGGAVLFRESQRQWLRYSDKVCDGGKKPATNQDRVRCLHNEYTERLGQLSDVGQVIGPFRFNRIDLYRTTLEQDPDGSGSRSGYDLDHVAYPQIDNPTSAAALAWNRKMAQQLETESDCDDGDDDRDYVIGYANARFISLQWQDSTYCHGTPHGSGNSRTDNEILSSAPRPATVADIFVAAGWQKPLQGMFRNALKADGWSPPENGEVDGWKDIDAHVIAPDRWLFTDKGLQTAFDSYEGGCYACNPGTPTVPWASLKPILARDAIVP